MSAHRLEKGREGALCILYAADVADEVPTLAGQRSRWLLEEVDEGMESAWGLIKRRLEGLEEDLEGVDEDIQSVSTRWRVDRMAIVDRNILRIGIFELLEMEDVPPIVTINACVDLAKSYGEESTPGFVNGLLDQFCSDRGIEVE